MKGDTEMKYIAPVMNVELIESEDIILASGSGEVNFPDDGGL